MYAFGDLDATAQAQLVRQKEVTPLELVEAAIARIEDWNPSLNAVVDKFYDQARQAARGPLPDGPFTGVPFLVKDILAAVAGTKLTAGSAFQKDFVTPYDSELVKRHRAAGLIIVGKTNTPEYGILPTTESRLLGPCKNPWDRTRSTGGSSGGSAAAVAARMVPMAHANDGGGSIRIPAACCGVFGLKPTRGRNPLGPLLGDVCHGFVAEHAVTRTVRDSAALLDATCAPDVGDPYYAPPRQRPYLDEVSASPGKLRIAYMTRTATGVPIQPECQKGLVDTVALLGALGHELVEKNPDMDGNAITQAFITVWAGFNAWSVADSARAQKKTPQESDFEPLTWALYQLGKTVDSPSYLMALTALQAAARQVQKEYHAFDVIVTPTLAEPPVPLGTFVEPPGMPIAALMRAAAFTPYTPFVNMTGQPAMSVPLSWTAAGLPIGMHFIARYGDEATLFRLAGQLEKERPWAARQPALSR